MNVHFRFRFVFGRKWNFIFVGIFVYGRKWKMLFGRPLVYITKRPWSWSWDVKSWSWSWKNFSLGLGLEKSLDYITATIPPGPLCLIPPTAHVMQRLIWPQKLCTSSPLFNMEHWYHKPIFLVILLKHENEKNATKEYHHLQPSVGDHNNCVFVIQSMWKIAHDASGKLVHFSKNFSGVTYAEPYIPSTTV